MLIVERFVALLRRVEEYRDEHGRGYGAIVIIAHSQGTVVAADTLRLLRAAGVASPAPEIRLLTLGSPLRAIYARAFPRLYGWVERNGRGSDPQALGVKRWINAFRSGDYIGRELWMSDHEGRFETGTKVEGERWTDTCLGAGAHTRYWQDPAVADVLWRLIDDEQDRRAGET